MKPSFALNLSHDGISLLHRAQAGWLCVGDVSLDAPDLVDELVVLRRTATDLEAGDMTTKLVIPNSQVLYFEIDAPGPSRADRIAQIQDALVGLTPYQLRDVVFDWTLRNDRAAVAVVARETLAEAETFATQYRFNPVSFVAMPSDGDYDGEPFFGTTRHAANLLGDGETVEPDERRIEVLGRLGDDLPSESPAKRKGRRRSLDAEAPVADAPVAEASADGTDEADGRAAPKGDETSGDDAAFVADAVPEMLDEVGDGTDIEAESETSAGTDALAGAERVAAEAADTEILPDDGAVAGAPQDSEMSPARAFETTFETAEGSVFARPPESVPLERRNDPVFGMSAAPEAVATLSFSSRRTGNAAHVNDHAVPPVDPASPEAAPSGPKVEELPPVASALQHGDKDAGEGADRSLPGSPADPAGRLLAKPHSGPSAGRLNGAAAATPLARRPMPPPVARGGGDKVSGSGMATPASAPPAPAFGTPASRAAAIDPKAPELAGKPDPMLDMARTGAAEAAGMAKAGTKFGGRFGLRRAGGKAEMPKPDAAGPDAPGKPDLPGTLGRMSRGKVEGPAQPGAGRPARAEAEAMTVFGARGIAPPKQRPRFVGVAVTLGLLLALAVVALWSTYFMNDVASRWFGLGGGEEIAAPDEPAPVIVPEDLAIAPDMTPDTAPDPAEGPVPAPDQAAPEQSAVLAEQETPPSVPLPGIEVTDLQPEQPEAPAEEAVAEMPATEEPAVPVPAVDAPAASETPAETPAGTVIAAAEPPAEPAPPTGPESDAASLDDGPPPDIATIAPELASALDGTTPGETAAPADGGAAPGELEIVRLEEPQAAEVTPEAGLDAPPPARVPVPGPEEAAAIYERTGISVLAPAAAEAPSADRIDTLALSSADPGLADPRSRGLPTGESLVPSDTLPPGQFPPLPLNTVFDLDDRGLVRATPDGALTPQGVLVFEGTPSFVPPPRPGTEPPQDETSLDLPVEAVPAALETAAAPPGEPEASAGTDAETDTEPVTVTDGDADTARQTDNVGALDPETLRDLAPILSESDLAEADERAQFGGLTRDELADVRPPLRPGGEAGPAPETDAEAEETVAGIVMADAGIATSGTDETATDETATEETATEIAAADMSAGEDPNTDESAADEPAAEDRPAPLIDMARIVPPLRPGTEVSREEGLETASLAGDLIDESAAELEAEPDAEPEQDAETAANFDGATDLAVDASSTPATRPAGFGSIVQAALEEAATAPPTPDRNAPADTPATPAPTVASAPVRAPDIPSSAAVASTATDENALRLNRVNLIGVYGSASNRRALVRLASGRYVKVQVGDTVDGGQVAAIGDDELHYVKRGKTIKLALPSG